MARKREYDRDVILQAFTEYVEATDIPIVSEFAATQGLGRQFMYDCEEFSDVLEKCLAKKEAALERKALGGEVNVTMAIFSLKQMGWSDKHESTVKGDANAPLALNLSGSDIHG